MDKKDNFSESYALGLTAIAIALTIFLIPNQYKFSWSNSLSLVFLMIASIGFAFSIQNTMKRAKETWDNLGTSLLLFYIIYGIIIFLIKYKLLNPYTTLILLAISTLPFFGFFKGIINLIIYLFQNFKNNKTNFFDVLIKLIPISLPVISLILKILKII